MKIFYSILFYFFAIHSSAQFIKPDSIFTETGYYTNGNLRSVIDYCLINNQWTMCGRYEEYDSLGQILVKGQYKVAADSLDCFECYHLDERDSTLHPYSKSGCREVRVGTWNYYYSNGQLKESGCYSLSVHEQISSCLTVGIVGDIRFAEGLPVEHLKSGYWNYYDENGKLTEQIFYSNGLGIKTWYSCFR